jgi:hypothetical protein
MRFASHVKVVGLGPCRSARAASQQPRGSQYANSDVRFGTKR